MILYDNHNRAINYLRLAVTDRCNLRCSYCMPGERVQYLPRTELMTFGEMERLVTIVAGMGITKLRLTGGEPFVRQDLMAFIRAITSAGLIRDLHITTNGVKTARFVPELKQLGIASVNLSMDSLDRERFARLTLRDELPSVLETLHALLEHQIPLKINTVVMGGENAADIVPLLELTREQPIEVRFIEEMPFNGKGEKTSGLLWNHRKILAYIHERFDFVQPLPAEPAATASRYQIPGYKGSFGIIAAFSRTFCGTCNRIRVTARGDVKTCLYDRGVVNVRELMRSGATDDDLREQLLAALSHRAADGFEAEKRHTGTVYESMSAIGG